MRDWPIVHRSPIANSIAEQATGCQRRWVAVSSCRRGRCASLPEASAYRDLCLPSSPGIFGVRRRSSGELVLLSRVLLEKPEPLAPDMCFARGPILPVGCLARSTQRTPGPHTLSLVIAAALRWPCLLQGSDLLALYHI